MNQKISKYRWLQLVGHRFNRCASLELLASEKKTESALNQPYCAIYPGTCILYNYAFKMQQVCYIHLLPI